MMQQFKVEGMTCGHCVRAITHAVQSNDPAAEVQVDLASAEVGVQSTLTADVISSLITAQGYVVQAV